MSTTTETSPPPELTIINRVVNIPLVSFSLQQIDGALSSNAWTRFSYSTAKELSTSVVKLAEPFQAPFGPIISHADNYANKAYSVVESRYPYPFQAKPEDVASAIKGTYDDMNKKIDDNIKTPAVNVATGIDKRFSPLVDYYEVAVKRTNGSDATQSTSPDAKYQYQRAIALSKELKDNFFVYSNEQFKTLQAQNVLLQSATNTAHAINNLATTLPESALHQIHALSDNMLSELSKLRTSVHDLQHQLPPQIQQTYIEVTTNLSTTISELRNIIAKENITIQEKVKQVGHEVQNRVTPLLDTIKKGVSELLSRRKEPSSESSHLFAPK
ncbi:hypothetical protein H0H93_001416 [Arthromyces matolae]|nr:hypothetical protein H0H93_001416 [Arthromyces matolae]